MRIIFIAYVLHVVLLLKKFNKNDMVMSVFDFFYHPGKFGCELLICTAIWQHASTLTIR